jgi:hypothetical protein
MKKIRAIAVTAIMLATLIVSANALTIGDSNEIGFINYGIPSGDADVAAYVNHLIDMGLNTSDTALGQDFTRSGNDFGPLADAVLASRTTYGTVGSDTVEIDLGAGYLYLLAKYDGPNYGSEVWYVGGLTGKITIPSKGGGYGISGTSLFNGTPSVPDGGMTLVLLGSSLTGLALLARSRKFGFAK